MTLKGAYHWSTHTGLWLVNRDEYGPLIGHSPDDDDEVLHRGEVLSVRQPHAQGQGLRLSGAADNEILKKKSFISFIDI